MSIFTAQTSFTDSSSHLSLIHSQPGIRTDLLLVIIDYFAGWSFKVNRIKLYPLLSWLLPLMTILTCLCYVCLHPILMLESQSFLWIAELYCIIWDLHLSFYCNKIFDQKQLKKERICFSSLSRGPVLHGREVKAKEAEEAVLTTFKIRKQRNECVVILYLYSPRTQSRNGATQFICLCTSIKIILQKPIT